MPIRTERQDRTYIITLDRPEAHNSIDTEMFGQLGAAWDEFEKDDGLLVAIVTGAGERAFCAGRDLVKSSADAANDWSRTRFQAGAPRLTPDGIMKPIIAAINGHCLAAGLGIALACDVRIASPNATFGTMAAKRGIVAGSGQTQRLARFIPFGVAMEMILFAERIDAERALQVSLINKLVSQPELMDSALEWASILGANGPLAMKAMKRAAYEGGWDMNFSAGMALEAELYEEILETEDAKEGPLAFAQKRPAQFQGR